MKSPNAKNKPKMQKVKRSRMTLDKLALITQREFTNVYEQLHATNRTMDERFDAVDMRFNSIDKKFEMVDKKFDAIDRQFEAVNRQFEAVNRQFEAVNRQFEAINTQLKELNFNIIGMGSRFDNRISFLEQKVGV